MSLEKTYALAQGILRLIEGDITKDDADAIVNAANSALAGGGGVDGAIHRAAGPGLPEACRAIIAEIGRLPAGGAVITPGFDLPARHIIHTVGPIWRGGNEGEPERLRSAYVESLARAIENGLSSISFPAVSTGVYGFPVEKAAPIALTAMAEALTAGSIREVRVYLHGKYAYDLWRSAADALFG
ncbi:Appr-1-p processing domain protein [Solidesulfovibrio fructosivorans JJ]]|uniref:Appr-1-p processing domain protein n=1 Tax=Solidesulfovibrio fructosivorans JJ] TaxID=596151 RepID=E1K1B3_SOLFR|nr:O-acetyl-ADP-ribose deacetylase [Solidesulfovibrio fructosivorans]EFL49599.1 Appr-1-p processing domain protein [Solidesulfovibrio fructosivorans JJ]]